jgi:hypothetical protein
MSGLQPKADLTEADCYVRFVPTGDIGSLREMKVTPPTETASLQWLRQNILGTHGHEFLTVFVGDDHGLQHVAPWVLDLVGQELSDSSSCRRLGRFQAGQLLALIIPDNLTATS